MIERKSAYPGLPRWLEAADKAYKTGEPLDLSRHLDKLLSLHNSAERGNPESAEELAALYETGNLPRGVSLKTSIVWHMYAATLGSVNSPLKAAQLLLWTQRDASSIVKAIEMAKTTIKNLITRMVPEFNEIQSGFTATMLILEKGSDEEAINLITELLNTKIFQTHPQVDNIHNRLRLASSQHGLDKMSMIVINGKIHEDGEFKSGIYKILERPLPLVELPNPEMVKEALDREYPWFSNANEQVYRQLIMKQHSSMPVFKLRPLLLAGAPGIGKTSWVRRLAELCKVPFRPVMAAGANDAMYLRGTPRGWSSARPGAVIQAIAIEKKANPLFLIDEVEKTSEDSRNGRLWDTLLQLLEPATSTVYLDECLQVPCNLSQVSWIATANEISRLPKPLQERFTIVVIKSPTEQHFMALVKSAINSVARDIGIDVRMLPTLTSEHLDVLRRCNSPREICRTVQMIIEMQFIEDRHYLKRN